MGAHNKRHPGKNRISIINGYYLKKREVKCKYFDNCFECGFSDCRMATTDPEASRRYYERKRAEKQNR